MTGFLIIGGLLGLSLGAAILAGYNWLMFLKMDRQYEMEQAAYRAEMAAYVEERRAELNAWVKAADLRDYG